METARWIALVAKTPADARDYMIEGPGGFLRNVAPHQRPDYEPSKRRLTWPNGSWATIYSDEEPEQLRGYSGDTAWLDEFGKYRYPEQTWDNLQFGMREVSSDHPRKIITTTPRPLAILRRIQQMPGTIALRIEETSSVVVAESRKLATSPQQAKNIQHSFKSLVECGNRREVIQRSQNTCMQEEVYRIDVIVSGLFEVESIGAHLALRFLLHNLPSSFTPWLRGLELRAEHSDEEKRNTFSEQVSVRRKISREMNINVASGDSQRPKPLRAKLRGHALGAGVSVLA